MHVYEVRYLSKFFFCRCHSCCVLVSSAPAVGTSTSSSVVGFGEDIWPYISALDTLPDMMIRILTCYLYTSPKLLQCVAMCTANPNFLVYPPERGEIGQSLPRLAHFHIRPL